MVSAAPGPAWTALAAAPRWDSAGLAGGLGAGCGSRSGGEESGGARAGRRRLGSVGGGRADLASGPWPQSGLEGSGREVGGRFGSRTVGAAVVWGVRKFWLGVETVGIGAGSAPGVGGGQEAGGCSWTRVLRDAELGLVLRLGLGHRGWPSPARSEGSVEGTRGLSISHCGLSEWRMEAARSAAVRDQGTLEEPAFSDWSP